jgi:hypothetical protein
MFVKGAEIDGHINLASQSKVKIVVKTFNPINPKHTSINTALVRLLFILFQNKSFA